MDYMKNFAYCIKISWTSSAACFILRGIVSVFMAIIPFLTIYLSKLIVDWATKRNGSNIFCLLAFLMFTNICNGLFDDLLIYIKELHDDKLKNMIEKIIMEKMLNMDIAKFDSPVFLDSLQAINNCSYTLINAVWNIFRLISAGVSFCIAAITALSYNYFFVIIIVFVMIPYVIADQKFAKKIHDFYLHNIVNERKKNFYQNMALERQWAVDVRLYNLRQFIIKQYSRIWKLMHDQKKHIFKRQLFANTVVGTMPELALFCLSMIVILDVQQGKIAIGDYIFITGIFSTLCTSLYVLVNVNATIYKDRLNIDTLTRFKRFKNNVLDAGVKELSPDKIDIEFKRVSFSYPDCDKKILHDVCFKIKAGEKVCFVGINGSGKSTIIKLLLRYYDVTDGEILINGIAIKQYTLQSIRNTISVLFQDIILYPFELKENITIADIDKKHEEEKIVASLHIAGAEHLLTKLPYGMKTYIHKTFNNEGYEPSGGEAQQIALARVIYRSRPLLILDEATSDLDPETGTNMMKNIVNIWKNKTVIFTSHRLSIANLADRIIVIEDGRIIETGRHEQLLKSDSRYAELYNSQVNGYK